MFFPTQTSMEYGVIHEEGVHRWVKGSINRNHICPHHHRHRHLHHAHAALPSGSAPSSSGCTSAPPPSNLHTPGSAYISQSVTRRTVTWLAFGRMLLLKWLLEQSSLLMEYSCLRLSCFKLYIIYTSDYMSFGSSQICCFVNRIWIWEKYF